MSSPAKRLRTAAAARPIVPLTVERESVDAPVPVTPVPEPTEEPASVSSISEPAEDPVPETPVPESVEDLGVEWMDVPGPDVLTPGEAYIAGLLDHISGQLAILITGIQTLGLHQQYMTDTFATMQNQFGAMMAGGNPLKMISQMLGGKKGT